MSAVDLLIRADSAPSQPRLNVPIRTRRLELRPFSENDVGSMAELLTDTIATRWIGGVKPMNDIVGSVVRMKEAFEHRGWGTLAVIPFDVQVCVGYCGVRPLLHTTDVEIAFGFRKAYWGAGYATEAAEACIGAHFHALQVPSIVATGYRENSRSVRVIEKLGLTFETQVFGAWPLEVGSLYRVTREAWSHRISSQKDHPTGTIR
jgi:RimJ/RimL family protein N-acetyltransferase